MNTPRTLLVSYAKKLAALGLITGSEGNLSLRQGQKVYTTPTGAFKGDLLPQEIVEIDLEGRVSAGGQPSSEVLLHLAIYKNREDVKAVVHAHPPYTLALDLAEKDLSTPYLAEAAIFLPRIVRIPFAPPGSKELVNLFEPHVREAEVFILSRHGAVTLGKDLHEALNRMCILEKVARVLWLAYAIKAHPKPLTPEELRPLG